MPGPLQRFKSDPNSKGRGGGSYYHRGNGVYSKYSMARDKKHKGAKPGKKRMFKRNKIGHGPKKHTHDNKKRSRTRKR